MMQTLSERFPNEMMPIKAITLTQGQITIIDPEDWDLVRGYKWCAYKCKNCFYAITHIPSPDNPGRMIGLHVLLTGYSQTDHRNGDGLDNRRCNLREATTAQNSANRGMSSRNNSGYKGVSWHRGGSKWQVHLKVKYRNIYLGLFDDPEAAARAYDHAAIEHFGEFARTNTMLGLVSHDNCQVCSLGITAK